MIKIGSIIKHKQFKDVAILVTNTRESDLTGNVDELDGRWINLGFVNTYDIGYMVSETSGKWLNIINKSDWLVLHEDDFYDKCYRYSRWVELGQP